MALAGAITQLALYGGIAGVLGGDEPTPEPVIPPIVAGGGSTGGDRAPSWYFDGSERAAREARKRREIVEASAPKPPRAIEEVRGISRAERDRRDLEVLLALDEVD